MSNQDKSRKTEKPTRKTLRDARKRGQVARSRELVSVALAAATFVGFWLFWDVLFARCLELLVLPGDLYGTDFDTAFNTLSNTLSGILVELLLPLALFVLVVAVLANVLQFGFLFAVEPITPKLSKISLLQGFKRIVSLRSLMEFLLSLVKTVLIVSVVFFLVTQTVASILQIPFCGLRCVLAAAGDLFGWLALLVVPPLMAMAVMDLAFQKRQHINDNKMTKEDAKRQHKQEQGDPLYKFRRRQLHREMLAVGPAQLIETASVLILSGNLSAVLYYDARRTPLPIVLALGRGEMTRQLVRAAKRSTVPVIEDRFAQSLAGVGRTAPFAVPGQLAKAAGRVMRLAHAAAES